MSTDLDEYEADLLRDVSQLVGCYGLADIRSTLDDLEAEQARKTPPKVHWAVSRVAQCPRCVLEFRTGASTPNPDDVRALEAWVAERLRDGDL